LVQLTEMSEDEGGKVYRKGAGRADLLGNTKGGREAENWFRSRDRDERRVWKGRVFLLPSLPTRFV
jgi:hypothetical protein